MPHDGTLDLASRLADVVCSDHTRLLDEYEKVVASHYERHHLPRLSSPDRPDTIGSIYRAIRSAVRSDVKALFSDAGRFHKETVKEAGNHWRFNMDRSYDPYSRYPHPILGEHYFTSLIFFNALCRSHGLTPANTVPSGWSFAALTLDDIVLVGKPLPHDDQSYHIDHFRAPSPLATDIVDDITHDQQAGRLDAPVSTGKKVLLPSLSTEKVRGLFAAPHPVPPHLHVLGSDIAHGINHSLGIPFVGLTSTRKSIADTI